MVLRVGADKENIDGPFLQAGPNLEILGGSILLVCIDVVLGTALIGAPARGSFTGAAYVFTR